MTTTVQSRLRALLPRSQFCEWVTSTNKPLYVRWLVCDDPTCWAATILLSSWPSWPRPLPTSTAPRACRRLPYVGNNISPCFCSSSQRIALQLTTPTVKPPSSIVLTTAEPITVIFILSALCSWPRSGETLSTGLGMRPESVSLTAPVGAPRLPPDLPLPVRVRS